MDIETLVEPIRARRAVLSFSGWPDAGRIVELALAELKQRVPNTLAARCDLDGFWHIDAMRPQIQVQHGQIQAFEWPSYDIFSITGPTGTPVLIGAGPEPGCHWRTFSRELIEMLQGWGCESIYLLGSLSDQVFHDEVLISSVIQNPRGYNEARELDCQRIEYQGPAAIHAAVMSAAEQAGLHCLSFWSHLPFYLNGPHELIMARWLEILGKLLELELDVSDLVAAWQRHSREIEEFVTHDQDLQRVLKSTRKDRQERHSQTFPAKIVNFDDFLKRKQESAEDEP